MIYTRPQLLNLQNSPLVKCPPDMPELKYWFGEHEPSLSKKDSEPTTPNSARERRFRRDPEDGETSTRPSFRSTLSQPSQMGNFKHQSLRDRDRDREGDKDRERDIRDKEGQERLRNLSDKYDRDRLAAPGLRNKERDIAPHLAVDSAIRGSAPLTAATRRAEARDGAKKKVGEVSEDWRRGSHATRQERYEQSRATREDRERPRSRARDSSQPRRDVSSSRRDRDTEDKEPGGERRDDHRKPPRDDTRRDHRRDRDERRERERDVDRDADKDEVDDPRRWRDDGKRDERLAAKRHAPGEKAPQENGESSGDRRWTVVEERDGRSKRNHRDRRTGAPPEDGKEDRRDRDREREKEPAWMDTYIPDSTGILGGKGGDGELDGIQAWKKGLKEQKEKTVAPPKKDEERPAASESAPEKPLDEIQLFRLLMKREEEKKQEPVPADTSAVSRDTADPAPPGIRVKASQAQQVPATSESVAPDSTTTAPPSVPPVAAPIPDSSTRSHDSSSLLSIFGKAEPLIRPPPLTNSAPVTDASADKIPTPASSRFFPNPIHQNAPSNPQNVASNNQNGASNPEKAIFDRPPSAQFNPPQGSRLLAFGARPPPKSGGLSQPLNGLNQHDPSSQHTALPNPGALSPELPINHAPPKSDSLRTGFSPFEDQSRMSFGFDEPREQGTFSGGLSEPLRRDRAAYSLASEAAGSYTDSSVFDPSTGGYSAGKGSRLAKFFDSKGREAQAIQNPGGFASSSSPNPGQRHDGGFNPMDHHVMDGLLSKLNSSAQIQRPNVMSPNSAPSSGGVSFGQQAQNHLQILQQQHNQPQHLHLHSNNRLDSLYESRLEDRNFVPDGMVPGLRSAPPPRSRDSVGMYSDSLDDSIHFNPQRLPPQHHRGIDPMYNPVPSVYAQQGGRNAGIPMQPQLSQPRRRPPLEGPQFMGMPGLPSAGLHSGLHPNAPPQQQSFNNFAVNGNLNYGGGLQPQMRVPPSSGHQLQGNLQHHQLAGLGHANINANQAQLLGLGGGGMRGIGIGGFAQQGPPAQMQQPIHALRQQEQQQRQQQLHHQQQLPPHMMAHHQHPHQQGIAPPNNNQPDLMALLMGGTVHRD
ncbi:hypothetical protein B0H17DRAFT_1336307 [Mycena rosella]|uniref:Uncharacterized protein n=1 Tax=Mycena rosella TaxID=1033263 RepID=A0AAD7CW43_MYCRO|nr:hypothetical protein B0H17DRAFT_1336307 [Mycena rosella]